MQWGSELVAVNLRDALRSPILPSPLLRDSMNAIEVPSARHLYQLGLQVGIVAQLQLTMTIDGVTQKIQHSIRKEEDAGGGDTRAIVSWTITTQTTSVWTATRATAAAPIVVRALENAPVLHL